MAGTRQLTPSALAPAEPGATPGVAPGARPPELPPGLLAGYRAEELLGAGAMGVVWRATHLGLQRPVAIKLPTVTGSEHVERFVREGRLLSRLEHPNLVRVYDAGEADGSPYLVMEFVRGCTLLALASGQALAPGLAVALVVQLLEGLEHAHAAGVLHRDVKSENALVTAEGVLKLADFGLARSEFEPGKTQVGMIMGTPAYMSPEQARGLAVDARGDLYSAAVVLFELAAGRLPFVSDVAMDLLAMQIREAPPLLSQVAPQAPKALAAAVARGLAKRPEERFATAREFAACLRKTVDEQRLEQAAERLPALVAHAGAGGGGNDLPGRGRAGRRRDVRGNAGGFGAPIASGRDGFRPDGFGAGSEQRRPTGASTLGTDGLGFNARHGTGTRGQTAEVGGPVTIAPDRGSWPSGLVEPSPGP